MENKLKEAHHTMSYRLKHLRKRKKPGMRIIYITKLICKPFIHKGALTQLPLPRRIII